MTDRLSRAPVPVPAAAADALQIWQLRRQREDWLADRDIHQWLPGEIPRSTIEDQVDRGEWFVVREARVVAALRLLWEDPDFWGPDDGTAVYVHGLMVDLDHAGTGRGTRLLDWAADQARDRGRSRLRLDSAVTNPGLTRYYERLGFTHRGRRQIRDLFEVNLWERPVGEFRSITAPGRASR